MSLIALKGWNYQTQTFETPSEFFNPRINPHFQLHPHYTLSHGLKALAKIFPRSLVKEIVCNSILNPTARDVYEILINDEEVPLVALLGLRLEATFEVNDDDEEYLTQIHVDLEHPAIIESRYMEWTYAYISYDAIDEDEVRIAALVKAFILENFYRQVTLQQIESCTLTLDIFRSFKVKEPSLSAIWQYHFGKIQYYKRQVYNGAVLDHHEDFPSYRTFQVWENLLSDHKVTVEHWGIPWQSPSIYWDVPRNPNDRSALHRIHQYSTNVAQLIPGALREPNELSDNLYGVELEVSSSVDARPVVEATDQPYCACKQDSSISGRLPYKYEIVSRPATTKAHKKAWGQILEKVGYQNFDVTRNTNNGMHVHVDLNAFKNHKGNQDHSHQKQFIWFFCNPVNRAFHIALSERDETSFRSYSNIPAFPSGQSLISLYAMLMNIVIPPYRGIICFKQDRNTHNYVTLEVRQFKGIVSLAAIWKNLEFVDSVFNFTTKTCFQSNTLDNYLSYIKSTPPNRYATLKEFLNRLDLTGILEVARIKQILWGMGDPEKVVHTIKKHNISIQPSHIETLNELIEGAKFALKNGQLKVIETNRSNLYDLDMVLHNKLAKLKKGAAENVSNPRP